MTDDPARMKLCLRMIVGLGDELARHGIGPTPYFPVGGDVGTPEERDYLIGRILHYAEAGLGMREVDPR